MPHNLTRQHLRHVGIEKRKALIERTVANQYLMCTFGDPVEFDFNGVDKFSILKSLAYLATCLFVLLNHFS